MYKMLNLNALHLLPPQPLTGLEQNPSLSSLLPPGCDYNLEEVSEIIKPVLTAPQCCQRGLYIQAMTTGDAGFLATNLSKEHAVVVSPVSSNWLVGRSTVCPIQLSDRSVSRRHAVLVHTPSGFHLIDLGSLNGTWINDRRLDPAERIDLQDGDLIQFGTIQVEFFLSTRVALPVYAEETTYY